MAAATAPRLHECARCGKKQPADRMVYRRHSGSRYCADINACDKRAKRKAK